MWSFARRYWLGLAAYAAALATSAVLGMLSPLVLRRLLDHAIPQRDLGAIDRLAALAGLLYLGSAIVLFVGGYVGTRVGTAIIRDLRAAVFDHIQRMPIAFFVRSHTGALQTRLNTDVINVQQLFTGQLFSGNVGSLAANVIVVCFSIGAMLVLSWQVTVLVLLLAVGFVLPSRQVARQTKQLQREQMDLFARMTSFGGERLNIGGALLVKLIGSYRRELMLFKQHINRLRHNNIRINSLALGLGVGMTLLASAGTVAVYWFGGRLVVSEDLTVGTLVALALYAQRAYGPIADLASARINIQNAMVSFDRVFEILDAPIPIVDPASPIVADERRGEVELHDVSYSYSDDDVFDIPSLMLTDEPPRIDRATWALRGVSFRVPSGTMTAVVGPSGAGKTTLSMLVSRLIDTTEGSVRIDGVDVKEWSREDIVKTVGVVPQDAYFFHDTVRSNLLYAKGSACEEELIEACERARIHELIASMPSGYDTVIGERGHRLSGGEKQRLALARLMLQDPKLVILDEATAHLDTKTEELVHRSLMSTLAGRTAVVIAHRLSTVRAADQIVVLDRGAVQAIGGHGELLRTSPLYHDLHRRSVGHTDHAL